MNFEIVPAHALSLSEQAEVANKAFAGYVGGWTDLDAETLARFLTMQGSDLLYSRFIRLNSELVGFGYINRTANILRLSGMGVVPEARGSGAARMLLEKLLEEGEHRGDEAMVLEVIEQNPRAQALYRRHGFRELGRLLGWRRSADAGPPQDEPIRGEEVPTLSAVRIPAARDFPEIPWQISRHAVAKAGVARAFRTETVCVVIGDPEATPVRIYAAISVDPPHGVVWKELRALLAGVMARFPHREFFAPAIFPEEFGTHLFEPLGFQQEPISQFLMRRELT
jgi:ribosomal protein S18 acetylase RimI-like enzyme